MDGIKEILGIWIGENESASFCLGVCNPEFKAKVVLEILPEQETVNQIAAKYGISPVVLSSWKKEFLERASQVFKKEPTETLRN